MLKTLSYDCGNPVIICLRANARSAFLFTGSPRSARDDKGTKWIIPQSLTTPGFAHPSNGGELSPRQERTNAHYRHNKSMPIHTDVIQMRYTCQGEEGVCGGAHSTTSNIHHIY